MGPPFVQLLVSSIYHSMMTAVASWCPGRQWTIMVQGMTGFRYVHGVFLGSADTSHRINSFACIPRLWPTRFYSSQHLGSLETCIVNPNFPVFAFLFLSPSFSPVISRQSVGGSCKINYRRNSVHIITLAKSVSLAFLREQDGHTSE